MKIGIIDDEAAFRMIAELQLKELQMTDRISFRHGEEAWQHLQLNRHDADALPDVYLIDLNMPIMDGWEFLDAFQGLYADLPKPIRTYIVTSSNAEQDRSRAQGYTFLDGYLTKPLKMETLREILGL